MVKVGLLDFCFDDYANTHHDQLRLAAYTAEHAEQHGCISIWYGEHHQGVFQASPSLMASIILANTSRLIVGTGGILASYYSPLALANAAALLACAYPDRFELGLARGKPAEATAELLRDGQARVPDAAEFERHAVATRALLSGQHSAPVFPRTRPPKLWLLGTGTTSALLAARLGAAYCHADFLKGGGPCAAAFQAYRLNFRPQQPGDTAEVALAMSVCATKYKGAATVDRFQDDAYLVTNYRRPATALADKILEVTAAHNLDRVLLLQADSSPLSRFATLKKVMNAIS